MNQSVSEMVKIGDRIRLLDHHPRVMKYPDCIRTGVILRLPEEPKLKYFGPEEQIEEVAALIYFLIRIDDCGLLHAAIDELEVVKLVD